MDIVPINEEIIQYVEARSLPGLSLKMQRVRIY